MVVAVVAMTIMLSIGLATYAFGTAQRHLATGERVHESAFNLAEGVLNSQAFLLAQTWPGSASLAFPTNCSSTTTATNCPDPATISAQFSGPEFANATWTTVVQDNGGSATSYYSTAAASGQPAYDANVDGLVWVRAQAVIGSVTRTVIMQVKAQLQVLPFPRNTITAGYASATNNGNKVLVDSNGSSVTGTPGQAGSVAVRCSTAPQSACLDFDLSKGQISPPAYQTGYPSSTIVTTAQLDQMRNLAKGNGTYTASGCPSSLAGSMVFIENGNCGGAANSAASPGVVVVARGTFSVSGGTYYGLIYAVNLQGSSGNVVTVSGCGKIVGAVAVEGAGGVAVGNCGNNLVFDSAATTSVKAYGDAVVVKGSWREI
jgi:hypothetical protein